MSASPAPAMRKAARLAAAGRRDEAAGLLTEAARGVKPDPRIFIRKGLLTGAIADFEKAMEADPGNRAAPFFLALAALERGELVKAEKAVTEALRLAPGNHSAMALSAVIAARGGETGALPRAAGAVPSAVTRVQALALLEVERAIHAMDARDMGAAEREERLKGPAGWLLDRLDDAAVWASWALSHALNLVLNMADPEKRALYRNITEGDRLAGLGRMDEAAEFFEKALKIDPDNPEALESLAEYHLEKGGPEKAAEFLDRLERALGETRDPSLLKRRGEIFWMSKKISEAREAFAEAGRMAPLDYFPPYREGLSALRMGDEAGAREAFAETLSRINPRLVTERTERLEKLIS
ncbi:MAG: tetratricopeptide repeat protein [Candidatus Nitrospinota bacterium M3_3B_026]